MLSWVDVGTLRLPQVSFYKFKDVPLEIFLILPVIVTFKLTLLISFLKGKQQFDNEIVY